MAKRHNVAAWQKHEPKAQAVVVSTASKADLEKYMKVKHDEKAVPASTKRELEALFLDLED